MTPEQEERVADILRRYEAGLIKGRPLRLIRNQHGQVRLEYESVCGGRWSLVILRDGEMASGPVVPDTFEQITVLREFREEAG